MAGRHTETASTTLELDVEAAVSTPTPAVHDESTTITGSNDDGLTRHSTIFVKNSECSASSVTLEKEESPFSSFDGIRKLALTIAVILAIVSYTITAFVKNFQRALPLLYIELVVLLLIAFRFFKQTIYFDKSVGRFISIIAKVCQKIGNDRKLSIIVSIIVIGIVATIIGLSIDDARRLISLVGLGLFIGGCWLFSWNRSAIKWRPVIGGLLFQFFFGVLILRTNAGFVTFEFIGNKMTSLIGHTNAGSEFVFNWVATGISAYPLETTANPQITQFQGPFAFSVLPTVIFFSALVSILYYLGALQLLIRAIGAILTVLLGTSVSESLNAAGNIFVGQTEAPLLIRPFLKDMTPSELHAVMTGGFATIAGGVLAVYITFGVSASHLLAASVMSAPAALAISKILYPEDEQSKTAAGASYEIDIGEESNVIEAAANGAAIAIQLAINIGGQLIAFLAIVSLLNSFLSYIGGLVDLPQLSFELICGYVLFPVAFVMGVPAQDCVKVGALLGKKVFVNEFVAYLDLSKTKLDPRSEAIAVFALCGFANFGSIGVALGGLTPIAPNQSKQLARLVFSAMIAGNIACFMTACIAGVLVK